MATWNAWSTASPSWQSAAHIGDVAAVADGEPIVFVVNDDVSVRESLERQIAGAGWSVETFESAMGFLARPPALVPSCLILDLALADLSGLELQKRVAADRAHMPVIFVTGNPDLPMAVQAMKAGAIEFLTRPFSSQVLLSAIGEALERSQAALDDEAQLQVLRARHAALTRREREVMTLVASGLLNKQVGGELGISEITVKAHRGSVMRKMKAGSLPDLVRMDARLQLAPAPFTH